MKLTPKEKALNDLFNDLQKNAYNVEYHNYYYKEANQIIRKHFEAFHKDKLREDIIGFLNYSRGKDYYKKYKQFADEIIDDYLNPKQ